MQATVVIPDLLKRLTEDITWTHNLGNAFLEQQDDVMDAVQRLRGKAKAAGKLDTTEQQKVETKVVETKTVIEIQPASTQVVYVPVYSPTVIWGPPIYPYPPMYYPPYSPGAAWLGFGVGIAVGIGISGGWGWGCGWGGGGNNIYINNNNNFHRTNNIRTGNVNVGNRLESQPEPPRAALPTRTRSTAAKYGGNTRGSGQATTRAAGAGTASANRAGSAEHGNRESRRCEQRGGQPALGRWRQGRQPQRAADLHAQRQQRLQRRLGWRLRRQPRQRQQFARRVEHGLAWRRRWPAEVA